MACKIHAAMRNRALSLSKPHFSRRLGAAVAAIAAALVALPASHAEKADRFKPLNVEADLPGKIDLLRQFVVFNGNVVVTKGTMTIRADRIEVRELPDGYHTAVAFGSPGKHATFRQKRDVPDEYIAGDAERRMDAVGLFCRPARGQPEGPQGERGGPGRGAPGAGQRWAGYAGGAGRCAGAPGCG